jgi:hypothetical protein
MMVLIFICGVFGAGWWWDEGSCWLISSRRYDPNGSTELIFDYPPASMRFFVHNIIYIHGKQHG